MNNFKSIILVLSLLFFGCNKKSDLLFKNPTSQETGINFNNTITETDELNILDYLYFYNGGGVALGDINNDGLVDVFLSGNQVKNRLYLNKGNLKFEDIIEEVAGVYPRIMMEGDMDAGAWSCGMVAGLINDIPTCQELIDGIMGEAEDIRQRMNAISA